MEIYPPSPRSRLGERVFACGWSIFGLLSDSLSPFLHFFISFSVGQLNRCTFEWRNDVSPGFKKNNFRIEHDEDWCMLLMDNLSPLHDHDAIC